MKILIVGCNGLLGQNLVNEAPSGVELYGASLEPDCYINGLIEYSTVDMSDKKALLSLINQCSPDWILNAAAMTNVDQCEKEMETCFLLNRDAVGWMAEPGIPMVHVSTDYIFNGTSGPYQEEDHPEPLGVYGKSKLESEPLVLDACNKSIVVRTMLLWGRGNRLRSSFTEFVKKNLEQKKQIRIVTDQIGNPTLASDLAAAIWKLINASCSGVYHVSGSELISRYAWAVKAAEYYGLATDLIKPVLTEDLRQAALRPLNSGFMLDKLIGDTGFIPKNVTEQLQAAG